jgi:hypothetical protein
MIDYITWKEVEVNDNLWSHPNPEFNGSITETAYNNGNHLYIGIIDYDDETALQEIQTLYPEVEITIKNEQEVQALLDTWYNGDVAVNNFEFIDNRPVDDNI